jgi:predicted enzyme related to lactoylglutathione lyase
VSLANSWIIINVGGPPTDKPTVTLEPPRDPDHVSSFLNIRVADIHTAYRQWRDRGAEFLTPPTTGALSFAATCATQTGRLIEVGQTSVC